MAGEYKNYNYYIRNGLPVPAGVKPKETGYERKTYSWYVRQGLTPPANLKPPKYMQSGATNVLRITPTQAQVVLPAALPIEPEKPETDDEILARISTRFAVLEALVADVVEGDIRGLIVSGPPGLGKSYTVEQGLDEVDCRIIKGHARATGLFKLLYEYREAGQILVFDDCDSVFEDPIALNILKTALDTTEERVISWMSEAAFEGSDGETVPTTFTYEGSIIFITNLDFDRMIQRGSKIGKHLEALISRSHYIDLGLKSVRDYVLRIKQVVRDTNMLRDLSATRQAMVINFIEANRDNLREISLRTALKVGTLVGSGKANWEAIAKITMCKN